MDAPSEEPVLDEQVKPEVVQETVRPEIVIPLVKYELYTGTDYGMMKDNIQKQLSIMTRILHNEPIDSFDYAHDILHFTDQERNQLWIIRTLLCYQMMIFGTHIMSYSSLHAELYTESPFQRTFRPEVISELPSFKLGIFGSITPTSDIDIGIQYSGKTPGFAALDYVVATMEDMFIHFLRIESTLKLDIEYYADMMTLPNPNSANTASPDLFYLDTSTFTQIEFIEMLPYAYASIYRNYLTAIKDLKTIPNEMSFISRLEKYGVSVNTDAMNEAKKIVDDYMSLTYNEAREIYYDLVRAAEEQVVIIRGYIIARNYGAIINQLIVNAMKAIASALVFRAESYTCAPTVMHVVRLLQGSKDKKYPVTYPAECLYGLQANRLKNPQCEIGRFGYEMSRLEQIGYMLRFQMTYCEKPQNNMNAKAKCNKKLDKYKKRLDDAILRKKCIPDRKTRVPERKVRIQKGGRHHINGDIQKTRRITRRRQYMKRTKKHVRR